jgi:hypothetical protein
MDHRKLDTTTDAARASWSWHATSAIRFSRAAASTPS